MANSDKSSILWIILISLHFEVAYLANPDKSCFPSRWIRNIPSTHVFHKIKKPIVVGHRGNILCCQENTIDGMRNLIDIGVGGIHMDAILTEDLNVIAFRDDSLKRMTSENFMVYDLPYSEIAKMNLGKTVHYSPKKTMTYSRTRKIPLLADALDAVGRSGKLIYVEMNPSNIPPLDPRDRQRSLLTGQKVAEVIRDMKLENQVILVSRDPFKLVSAINTHPQLVVDWWFGEEIYTPSVGDRMRKEFVDLPGLRECYIKTAPLSAEKFAEFVVESGVVSKSVNTSLIDLDFDIFDNPKYFSGRLDKTMDLLRRSYNKDASFGTFDVYSINVGNLSVAYSDKLSTLIKSGIKRIVTDDVVRTTKVLDRTLKVSHARSHTSSVFSLLTALLTLCSVLYVFSV